MNDTLIAAPVYDRTREDVGNIVEFGHVNTRIPDQRLATLFYVMGLGLTRDPYLVVGVDNMWINAGTCQFHLPSGPPQVLRGVTGLVLPDLDALIERLERVRGRLRETRFAFEVQPGEGGHRTVLVISPWGNRIRCHAPDAARFGRITLGMPYVELDTPIGTAARIAAFYREILDNPAQTGSDAYGAYARIPVGRGESLVYRETASAPHEYDGNHIQIALANFSGPHRKLLARGLITEESDAHQYRFQDIVDLQSGELLVIVEHEVRSMRHPMFARTLVNRNPAITNQHYETGHEAMAWTMPLG
jgi:hypothetical protein